MLKLYRCEMCSKMLGEPRLISNKNGNRRYVCKTGNCYNDWLNKKEAELDEIAQLGED